MKKTCMRMVVASLGVALLQTRTTFAAEKTAPNLARSREHIRDADNRKFFDYEMGNTNKSPAELGEKLPDGLARDALLSALLDQRAARSSKDVRVGAVAHPALPGVHVVWAYVPFDFKNRAPRLSIGLLKGDAREKVEAGQWISEPIRDMELAQDEVPLAFDFCAFPLGRLGRAFGLRTLTHGCGAGGSICSATNLLLFVSLEGKLTKVFDAQVAFFGNFGGDWHEDGTRDHTVEESNAVVRLKGGRSKTSPPPVIEKVLVGGRAKQRWTWQVQEAAEHDDGTPVTDVASPGWYVTEDPEFLGTVNNDSTNRPAHRFAPPRTFAVPGQLALPPWRGFGAMPGVGGGASQAAIGLRGELYVGGAFEFAGDVPARNVAVWNGHAWSALGAGIEKGVKALTVDRSGKLYVASTDRVSVWNGSAWATLGESTREQLIALAVSDAGVVYRASQERVSMWNGSAWSALANGWKGRLVRTLAVDGTGRLYAGGWAGKNRSSNLAVWDGNRWSEVGGGTDRVVSSLAVDRADKLYVGGTFQHAGGQTAHSLAIWADGAWRTGDMGDLGPDGVVDSLLVDPQGGLYVYGRLESLGPGFTSRARWNGSAWSVPPAFAIAIDSTGALYDESRSYGRLAFATLRRWDGHDWIKLGNGMDEPASTVAITGVDDLFIATPSNDMKKSTVARWKNGAWSDLRCPLHRVNALAVDGGGNLFAGGRLPKTSGEWTMPFGVYRWNGTAWSALAQEKRASSILALATDLAGNLYVAGEFGEMAGAKATSVARWNGNAWFALDAGISDGRGGPGRVSALAVDATGNLYAAGELAAAGGSPARNIARWDGHAWSALGEGTAFPVRALAVARTGQVYAGDGWSKVFAWDGHAWSAMAPGMTPQILALATDAAGSVYAAGTAVSVEGRLTSGGIPSKEDRRVGLVVKWTDRAWVPLGIFDAEVQVLATDPSGGIHAAGPFLTESGRPVGHVARLDPSHIQLR